MKLVKVHITLKEGVLDPQGKAVQGSLNTLGYDNVQEVRVGKYLELTVNDDANIEQEIEDMCSKLLANPVIENYSYTVEEGVAQ
ncbi:MULTISPECIES: phosphoribosylformylglycinamidine synthase subunit PurS [Gracilibacillus]|uniref:Phosphoribosylformylglycinamidine synthase subunit PurS n=2 Tax=Gracilibacillus TaxID=74385 RepID=A0ABY4GJ68_9BACI|nr:MULTISPECIES: phosphoribosylformylglycinamidine synthase subunit PurS [Gracilibacillus]UOQ49009.1 phosphoribosylformylglycinamidine synthase subunit PurS [Gracilibacillus caseinilyticus]UOQ84403.1 phosphoribosylformylglycinamidine synthase subunit PurS [Gracilibacillus salinarum]